MRLVRAVCFSAAVLFAFVPAVFAQERPEAQPEASPPLSSEQAADAVVEAVVADDAAALEALAANDEPDPWIVVDELLFRGKADEAAAFATAAPRPDVERLAAYVAEQRQVAYDVEAHDTLARMQAAIRAGSMPDLLAAAEAGRANEETVTVLRILWGRALALRELHRYEESSATFSSVADSAERLRWVARAADACRQAGVCDYRRGDVRSAVDAFTRELAINEKRAQPREVATTLGNLCGVLGLIGETERAIEYAERAIEVWEQAGDRVGLQNALANLAATQQAVGRHREALELHERALAIARELGDHSAVAGSLGNAGLAHLQLGDWDEAEVALGEALRLYEELGDQQGVARVAANLGLVRQRRGEYEEALELQTRALDLARKSGNAGGVAKALGNIGSIHLDRGDYDEALRCQESALEIQEKLGVPGDLAETLAAIGGIHERRGAYAEAAARYDRVESLNRTLGDPQRIAYALLLQARVSFHRGAHARALDGYEEALRIFRTTRDGKGAGDALGNMALVHAELGELERAIELQEEALGIAEAMRDPLDIAAGLQNVAMMRRGLGQHAKALEELRRARGLAEDLGNQALVAVVLGNEGFVLSDLGDLDGALDAHERALRLKREIGDREGEAATLNQIGSAHFAQGAYEMALERQLESLAISEELGTLRDEVAARRGIAASLLSLRRHAASAAMARRAVELVPRLTGGVADEQGAAARTKFRPIYDNGVIASVAESDAAGAAFFLESGRAGALVDLLSTRTALLETALPPDLLAAEQKARGRETLAMNELRRANAAGERARIRACRADLEEARRSLSDVIERIQRTARSGADVVYPVADELPVIQGRIAAGSALVLYGLVDVRHGLAMALVVTADGARIVKLGKTTDVDAACAALRADDETTDPAAAVAALRGLVIDPLKLDAETTRLLISPDGALSYVPFALLAPEEEIAYLPSGTTYGVLLDDAAKRGDGVLALGDPDYDVKSKPMADAVAMRGGGPLVRLPATGGEARAVGTVTLLGAAATEQALKDALAERPRWRSVHLACHGFVDAERPMLSSLALTPGSDDDGFLTALDVFRMKVPADLAVLSACETGKGKVYEAEGIVGLTRAFMFAGAPRVLVSLWKVDDEATRALMTKFYELWNPKDGKGVAAAAALHEAQAFVRSQEKWRHPRFWAAWVLWGLPDL